MNSPTLIVVIVVVAAVAVAAALWYEKRRSARLKQQFGREYDEAVAEFGGWRRAECELEKREKRVEKFPIHGLPPEERDRYAQAWRSDQALFVDQPQEAVRGAHQLVNDLMRARGYPVSSEFERNAADLSVRHANVVQHYRVACEIAGRQQSGQSNTEDLRNAMVHYRALFEELLGSSVQLEEAKR